LIKNLKKKF